MSAVEDEYEEEEILVFVEIDGLLDREVIDGGATADPAFKIIGMDTDSPYMQIGKELFVGEYREMAGSAVFFEEGQSSSKKDETFSAAPDKPVRYVGKTAKHLVMNRVFLNSRSKGDKKSIPTPTYLNDGKSSNYLFNERLEKEILQTVNEHKKNFQTCNKKSVHAAVIEPVMHSKVAVDSEPVSLSLNVTQPKVAVNPESNVAGQKVSINSEPVSDSLNVAGLKVAAKAGLEVSNSEVVSRSSNDAGPEVAANSEPVSRSSNDAGPEVAANFEPVSRSSNVAGPEVAANFVPVSTEVITNAEPV